MDPFDLADEALDAFEEWLNEHNRPNRIGPILENIPCIDYVAFAERGEKI
jgi:hypothetical protein